MEDQKKENLSDDDFIDIISLCFTDDFVSKTEVELLIRGSDENEDDN